MAKRNLYLNNQPVEEALEKYLFALKPYLHIGEEVIPAAEALGRVTAEPVFAKRNSPLYDSAGMDGIAVISERTHGASETRPVTLVAGEDFLIVDTGDPIRPPFDAVIMAEDIQECDEGVIIRAAAAPWQHVRPVGEDIVQGEMILPGGHRVRPMDVGVLLSGGILEICVLRQPRVAIFPTGTEIVEPGTDPGDNGIIESNSRMLQSLVTQAGGLPHRFSPLVDDYALIRDSVRDALADHDMVLINAGSSAGTEDFTVHVLRELGEVIVHGVAMKPGKPVILALVDGKPVVGVPGYPVSAYLAYQVFAAPVLERLTGLTDERMPVVRATLTRRLVSSIKHREYVRVKVGRVGGRLVASPLARGAGAAMSLVRADGFCIIEQNQEGIQAGEEVDVQLFRALSELDHTVVSIGSHDLILDLLADFLPNRYRGVHLSSTHVGSMGGLMALKNGEAHIAPTHLLDEQTGEYNIPILKRLFPNEPMALIKGVGRTQGIMVKPGNPQEVYGIADLPRVRYVNRQRGAGTRVLLDYLLNKQGIDPESIHGYDREAATHMAVAAAVQGDSADAGMGILSAARAMKLDFIPVGDEEYDFAIRQKDLQLPHIQQFIEALRSREFAERIAELGGYTTEHCGEVIILER